VTEGTCQSDSQAGQSGLPLAFPSPSRERGALTS